MSKVSCTQGHFIFSISIVEMCFYSSLSEVKKSKIEQRFGAKFVGEYQPNEFNAFNYPKTPVITHDQHDIIQSIQWGLIPSWAKDERIQSMTLNARQETLHEKQAFKNILHNRCMIIANGFYEWQWLDSKGKKKRKYYIHLPEEKLFAFAGLWSSWIDPNTGKVLQTYTIITTEANPLMAEIHNTKKRMPLILSEETEQQWLSGQSAEYANQMLMAEGEILPDDNLWTLF